MKTTITEMLLIHWHDRESQVLPFAIETLQYLVNLGDGYEMIETVQVIAYCADEESCAEPEVIPLDSKRP